MRKSYLLILVFVTSCLAARNPPIIIAHRGASGYRPEHTLASYELGIEMGSDYVECDAVPTKDHVLICRHESGPLEEVSNIEQFPEFASRRITKLISGSNRTGFFAEDFTYAELKLLRAREYFPFRNQEFNDLYSIPTLRDFLQFVKAKEKEKQKRIGVYIETKDPLYYTTLGLPIEEKLVSILQEFGYTSREDPVFIESFETLNLQRLKQMTNISLVQLIHLPHLIQADTGRLYAELVTPIGVKEIANYAQGIGPHKQLIVPDGEGVPIITNLIALAKENGLINHPWTFRREPQFINSQFSSFEEELKFWMEHVDVDGIFSDNPDYAVKQRNLHFNAEDCPSVTTTVLEKSTKHVESFIIGMLLISISIVAFTVMFAFINLKKNPYSPVK